MLQNGYPFWIFSKAISRRVIKIPGYNECALSRHRPRAAEYLNSGFTYQLVPNMAGFFMVINNQYYDQGFQSRFSATAIIFINGHDLFYNGGNSHESQAYDPALGGYIIQVGITSNTQVSCRCKHAP